MKKKPLRPPSEDQEIKPDIADNPDDLLPPGEAMRRERDTYGDDSSFPNRDDTEDEHSGSP